MLYSPSVSPDHPIDQINPPPRSYQGRGTILVVDDDAAVCGLIRSILGRHGYTVLQASDGENALTVADEYAGPIDLLLTDINMPGLEGHALDEKLLQTRPKLKALFMSGDPSKSLIRRGPVVAMPPFVPKPFTPDMLVRAVRAVLDSP
jgi:CheY-like chemotaxis protein